MPRTDATTDYPQAGDFGRVVVPRPKVKRKSTVVRFLEKVKVEPGGCWIWQARIEDNGYGWFRHGETNWAHRASYLLLVGPIPEGMSIDHLCYTPACVNPDHLDPVPAGRNAQRYFGGWSECDKLHPGEPTEQVTQKRGRVRCAVCHRVHEQERRRKRAGDSAPRLSHEALDES